jgi:predicted ATPase
MSTSIRGITLTNFKGFSEEVRLELRPITLLFGANSAGKSSVLQALQYFHEILNSGNSDANSTRHGGSILGLGGFQNLVHQRDLNRSIEVGIRFSLGDSSMLDEDEDENSDLDSPSQRLLSFMARLNSFKRATNEVELRIKVSWSEQRREPFVQGYDVVLNETWCARITASTDGRQAALKVNGSHPLFMVPLEDVGNFVTELDGLVNPTDLHFDYTLPDIGKERDDGGQVSWLPDVLFDLQEQGAEPAGAGFSNWLRMMDGARPKSNSIRLRAPGAKEAESLQWVKEFESFLRWLLIGPAETLRVELNRMRYVGPLRVVPSRGIDSSRGSRPGDWADGSAAWTTLTSGSGGLRDRVSSWMADSDRLNTGYAVSVRKTQEFEIVPGEDQVSLFNAASAEVRREIEAKRGKPVGQPRTRLALRDSAGLLHDPQDVGVGVSQVLPVVVAALDARASLVCIEQPELHVHPAVQVGLGDLFIDGSTSQGLSFLIETHSEHLVMRLQRRVREQYAGESLVGREPLSPEDVSFIYLGRDSSGHIEASHIGLTAQGKFDSSWPNGFFAERAVEVLSAATRAKLEARVNVAEVDPTGGSQ